MQIVQSLGGLKVSAANQDYPHNIRRAIQARNHAAGIAHAIKYGKPGDQYNFGDPENAPALQPRLGDKIVLLAQRRG